ncbi:hypothetical protein ONS95_004292 [Cadophora gregata]|uniref:uncharacterized protein n=1 Tax=Cadophora gregata TaxID=51156 RepID=UPI0026DD835D|nr:uncharacterized protein ONS95_004292 [Cadophora gregata]KAK0105327.1 hypothetical protein ONS96_004721 [Cadophora gregata f. sp. sojae]KAK0105774.1 hypothetical protein ONS95_004292 [Cadophora gregata]
MRFAFRSIALIVGLAGATSALVTNVEHDDSDATQGQTSKKDISNVDPEIGHAVGFEKRGVREKCSIRGYLAAIPLVETPETEDSEEESVPRRDVHGNNVTISTQSLNPRQMSLPVKNWVMFYKRELAKDNYQPIIWDIPSTQSDFNTAVFEDIGGDTAKSLGLNGLSGCSALIIASRSGVYIAHYFESLSFSPDPEWIKEYGSEDACFEATVVRGLKEGIPGRGRIKKPQQVSLAANAEKLRSGAGLRAYLIGPRLDYNDNPNTYKPKFSMIKKVVGEIIPELKPRGGRWTDIRYDALDGQSKELRTTPAGKFLFKYDPDHGRKDAKKKKAALWVEGSLDLHKDEWT